jgi:hypothetical protein
MNVGVLALLGVLVVWAVFRLDRWGQRTAVLEGLRNELSLHKAWVGTAYPGTMHGTWTDPSYLVHKLGTVAIDDAIVRGPGALLNPQLRINLVVYRQVVGQFNQLIDQAMLFQANAELWRANPPPAISARMIELIEAVHIAGIGDLNAQKAAHWYFMQTETELLHELKYRGLPIVWAVTGLNLLFVSDWGKWVTWGRDKLRPIGSRLTQRVKSLWRWAASRRP